MVAAGDVTGHPQTPEIPQYLSETTPMHIKTAFPAANDRRNSPEST